ncbi:uncharacterized protein RMCC_2388 [Mycolicibacterium canariasense]|uniref:HTH hxlR-type domain-containing protein n=1 Tax=Mycolicibacterium canariasense TaxID=228230 RepID=A0A100WBH7_MYCCR|nr:hypothetical protein AWB94_19555 [Mycolicibacterium canariasense]GAS95422.1 uncharacterized protein RMCC_2388 [Mycolicibacterium canariasense]
MRKLGVHLPSLRSACRDARRTRYEYRLTEKGLDLYPVPMALRVWCEKYLAPDGPFVRYRHTTCGGQVGTAVLRHLR